MLKKLIIPSIHNNYTPFFSTRTALVILTLWILVFNSISTLLISGQEAYASNLASERIVELANQERKQRGLEPLQINPVLTSAAYTKANNMFKEQYWDHFGPNGETPWQFIRTAGYEYSYAGENLGKGFNTSEGLHQAWMASITHRENITNHHYTDIGIAIVYGTLLNQNIALVVQLFGSPSDPARPLEEAIVTQGDSSSGNLKSIRIIYPQDGETYNDSKLMITGEVAQEYIGEKIEISSADSVLGTINPVESTWEFENNYDWVQGENEIEAFLNEANVKDSVSFFVDSVAPSILEMSVLGVGDAYQISMEVSKTPIEIAIISAEDIFRTEVTKQEFELAIPKNQVSGKVFAVLSDDLGNVAEDDITKYFPQVQEDGKMALGFSLNAPTAQRFITILFSLFVFSILLVQLYSYKKLGMLQQREGDFLMLGLWWLLLLFGSFIGYSGSIT